MTDGRFPNPPRGSGPACREGGLLGVEAWLPFQSVLLGHPLWPALPASAQDPLAFPPALLPFPPPALFQQMAPAARRGPGPSHSSSCLQQGDRQQHSSLFNVEIKDLLLAGGAGCGTHTHTHMWHSRCPGEWQEECAPAHTAGRWQTLSPLAWPGSPHWEVSLGPQASALSPLLRGADQAQLRGWEFEGWGTGSPQLASGPV